MRLAQRLKFLGRFTTRDLIDPGAWRSTCAIGLSATLVTALSLVAIGLALGTYEVRRAGLARDPLALCLWVGSPNSTELGEAEVKKLADAIGREPKAGLVGLWPFHVLGYDWLPMRKANEPDRETEPIAGRSLREGDPMLASRPPVHGSPFRPEHFAVGTKSRPGVIATRSMLKDLKYPPKGPPPKRLRLSLPTGPLEVDLVGVIDELPNGHRFVVTQSFADSIGRLRTLRTMRLRTGPIPAAWLKLAEPPRQVREALGSILRGQGELADPPTPIAIGGDLIWELETEREDHPTLITWIQYLDTIRDVFADETKVAGPDFSAPGKVVAMDTEKQDAPRPCDMAGIFVRDLANLAPASKIASASGLPVLDDVIPALEGIDRASSKALLTCVIGAFVLLLSSCVSLVVIQELRSELKKGEIGMLKAMGMDDGLLRSVFVWEAAFVWLAGTLIGLALGYGLGALMSWIFIAENPGEILLGFYCPWYLWLLPAITGPTFLLSALLGTRRARRAPPIETLRTS